MLHPIVAQVHPSPEQQPAVIGRGSDIVVTAGAGTGKTRTLVGRYLSLLADGLPLRSIVAITFTRKAAREMRNRVREAVQEYIRQPDLRPSERRQWQDLYMELDAARIGTIHQLCTEILRTHPAEAQVDPLFAVLDEGQAHLLRMEVLDEALAWAADDPEAAGLFTLLGERELRRTVDGLLRQRLDVEVVRKRLPADMEAPWQTALERKQHQVVQSLLARPEWVEAVGALVQNAADRSDDRIESWRREALDAIAGAAGTVSEQVASLARLGSINLTGGSAKAWPGGAEQLGAVKGALKVLRELWKREDPTRWDITALDERLAAAHPALVNLFRSACLRYQTMKRAQNALDFDDLEHGALQLLREQPAVRCYWQEQVQAILVDEYQDTNGRQRDLVALLNGGRGRAFVVGDAKQSIYRFRGADVTVFRAERERIQAEGGQVLALEVSYRAHQALIRDLNELLRPVLGDAKDAARPWVEPFAALRHEREEPSPGFDPPHIEAHLAVGPKSGGALDCAADALAARLTDMVESGGYHIGQIGQERPLAYSDVAILCRASSSFSYYEDALELAGVPYLTAAGAGFYERPEIRDLVNALQALSDPSDDLALAGLLRSPAFAVSDLELYRLCQESGSDGRRASLWEVVLGTSDASRGETVRRAARIISELNRWAGRTMVADLLKAFLDATDYRAALLQVGQNRAARNVSKLLADAHSSGIVGVGEFLEYLQGLRDAAAREGEARTPAEGVVQIMSVHQAKGLEFPVVVIGDITYGGGRGGSGVLVDEQLGLLLAVKSEDNQLGSIYRLGQEGEQAKDAAESDRLLYVAATRAREKLILSGCFKGAISERCSGWLGRIAQAHGLFLGLPEDYQEDGVRAVEIELQVGRTVLGCTIYEPNWGWEPAALERERPSVEMQETRPVLLTEVLPGPEFVDSKTKGLERDPPQRVWRVVPASPRARVPAWVIGKLVHEALASWQLVDGGFARWAEARAHGLGIADRRQLDQATRESRKLLMRFAQHPLFAEMDRADRRLHEVPYHMQTDGRVESGLIDALYLRDGRWTVVEFKTDEVRDAAQFEELLAGVDYLAQANRYARAVQSLLGQPPRLLLCMLDYADGIHIRELDVNARE